MKILEVKNLTKRFNHFTAVNGISFDLEKGEILGLVGPNGAGKTTIIQMLLGLTTPTTGKIKILGLVMPQERQKILQQLNFAAAYSFLPGNLTVWENMVIFSRLYGRLVNYKEIAELLKRFALLEIKNKKVFILSLGQKVRLNLCKALINNPKLLLLDEPTSSLDPEMAHRTRNLLKDFRREQDLSILLTSHNMREIENMCDRVIFISRGKIIAQGPPEKIARSFQASDLERVFIQIAQEEK